MFLSYIEIVEIVSLYLVNQFSYNCRLFLIIRYECIRVYYYVQGIFRLNLH